jgi:hypothetical protein
MLTISFVENPLIARAPHTIAQTPKQIICLRLLPISKVVIVSSSPMSLASYSDYSE